MIIIRKISEMQHFSLTQKREGKKIGLVPTMGSLHEGHLSLIQLARKKSDFLIVSIFVNPLQFGPTEDYESYPRDYPRDRALAQECEVDCIFHPEAQDMYPYTPLTRVNVQKLDKYLCGKSRPGHFQGVATVVCKLFNITQPDIAVFGLKDYQQFKIIEQMTEELCYPVNIIGGSTIREKDGLAMSSRNKNLSRDERKVAPLLYEGLCKAKKNFITGNRDAGTLLGIVHQTLAKSSRFEVDYLELVDGKMLYPKETAQQGDVIAAAVFLGKTRIIDKIILP